MSGKFDSPSNYEKSKKQVGYIPRNKATKQTYTKLGFKCGLEIHQQLKTEKKLFCRCPAGIYQTPDDFNAEIIRHMRPTLSELGEYDGTALMEFKTRKNITYRLKNENACTYEIDDTPPFPINQDALSIAIEIALLLKSSIVGELHITRKQYLDGSIPTGFQRTAIVGIEGSIPISGKKINMIQLSIEEDSCREVSDIGHERIYMTDRLGMPLIEMVTYPEMLTPEEAAEAGHYLRFLARSTGKVRTGIGAARQDVNVSISGGTRVEIKGVAHISWIPQLTHNEAFRQKALLEIKQILANKKLDEKKWEISHTAISERKFSNDTIPQKDIRKNKYALIGVNLPDFKEILSFFTQPGKCFADEISDRLKVIACLEKPNLRFSEESNSGIDWSVVRQKLESRENDVQLLIWGPYEDMKMALETIAERCHLAFAGVPNETRKSLPDGTTIFERVLPGPDRMYPDTDSAPLPIAEESIIRLQKKMPADVSENLKQMRKWKFPDDVFAFILKKNLFPLVKKIIKDFKLHPAFVGTLFGHNLKNIEGRITPSSIFEYERLYQLFSFLEKENLQPDIAKKMLPIIYQYPNMDFESVLTTIDFKKLTEDEILASIPDLKEKFEDICRKNHGAQNAWIMGRLRPRAIGNMELKRLWTKLDGGE
ncbi:MAG: Glu-tRNA(Gln) amidotransferase GatDE subunit E [Calditrichaeota bacterium]|nr:MAG: Glu-tRNA(Gln) amidotransferase GatDE subunit E [Calditrichota bacterium]